MSKELLYSHNQNYALKYMPIIFFSVVFSV